MFNETSKLDQCIDDWGVSDDPAALTQSALTQ